MKYVKFLAALLALAAALSACSPADGQQSAPVEVEALPNASENIGAAPAEQTPLPQPERPEPDVDSLYPFSLTDNYMSGDYGALNSDGKVVIPFEYSSCYELAPGLMAVRKVEQGAKESKADSKKAKKGGESTELCGIINLDGEFVVPLKYAYFSSNGDFALGYNGFGDGEGTDVIDLTTFDVVYTGKQVSISSIGKDAVALTDTSTTRFFNVETLREVGEPYLTLENTLYVSNQNSGDIVSCIMQDGSVVYVNNEGRLFDRKVVNGTDFVGGIACGYLEDERKYAVFNAKGETLFLLPDNADQGTPINSNLIQLSIKGEDGNYYTRLVDANGDIVLPRVTSINHTFNVPDGPVLARLEKESGQAPGLYSISPSNELTYIGDYECYDPIMEDTIIVTKRGDNYEGEDSLSGLYSLKSGEFLIPLSEDSLYWSYHENNLSPMLLRNRRWNNIYLIDLYDAQGNLLLTDLKNVYLADSGRAIVRKGFKKGMMDYSGEWLYSISEFEKLDD